MVKIPFCVTDALPRLQWVVYLLALEVIKSAPVAGSQTTMFSFNTSYAVNERRSESTDTCPYQPPTRRFSR